MVFLWFGMMAYKVAYFIIQIGFDSIAWENHNWISTSCQQSDVTDLEGKDQVSWSLWPCEVKAIVESSKIWKFDLM